MGPIFFAAEEVWQDNNSEDGIPVALRVDLLIVGSCPNGDPVAVDVRDQLGNDGLYRPRDDVAINHKRAAGV